MIFKNVPTAMKLKSEVFHHLLLASHPKKTHKFLELLIYPSDSSRIFCDQHTFLPLLQDGQATASQEPRERRGQVAPHQRAKQTFRSKPDIVDLYPVYVDLDWLDNLDITVFPTEKWTK